MSNLKLLSKFVKPYPLRILATILLGFSGALFNGVGTTLIVPIILKIVGQTVDLTGAPPILKVIISPFDQVPENYSLAVMSGSIIFIIFLKNLSSYVSTLVSNSLTRTLTSDMREAGVELLLKVDLHYYTKMRVGDLINSLGGEISRAASAIGGAIRLVILLITILVFIILLLSISWELTIATTLLLTFITLINQYAIQRSKYFGTELSEMSKAYSITVIEVLNGIRLVKATGNEDREYQKIKQLIRDREKADFLSQVNSEAIAPVSEVTGIIALIVIVLIGRALFASQITTVSAVLLTYLLVLLRLLPLISQLNVLRSSFANSSTSVDVVADFLRKDNKPLMNLGQVPYQSLQQGIHFDRVCFAYPNHENLVLDNVDLYLPKGTTLALVGGSGAGKSTMADLLSRFYDPTSGCITIDGTDLREFEMKSLRQSMGIVSQDTFLFNDSVRNNIAYGRGEVNDDEMIAAAKRANAYEFISKLPQGFDTLIGDRGVMLSGGQRQRLAIARALLQNPEILILDEATSALDTVSERLVQAALDDLSRDRTTLVIAHRLSTVQKADQIAVLDYGRVVELGTHQELLDKSGYYSRLYSMQFAEPPHKNSARVKILNAMRKYSAQMSYPLEVAAPQNQSLIRISHEIRTQLNSIIGILNLLLDGIVENSQEQQELIEESYKSALETLNMIDILDDIDRHNINCQLSLDTDKSIKFNNYAQKFSESSQQLRTGIKSLLSSLKLLSEKVDYNPQQENQLVGEIYATAVSLIDTLQIIEQKINIKHQ
ncbi:ATP-binding cassette domain-containing protein [Calothrix sp. FACHB-1219]|uniref:ABC transporter ATP-binding protein/permease n=1 Tax=unclassified Calothrix TaxID=2619626 RepID=UPI0016865177|nr:MULTISPECIES: ABC transporter ATP-binding protein/permease [unclassified Calothrix]MBD2201092.1 ATP-binding cassette domain-containing protein [Calothrix sp. FACHB-168]MBD2215525.1 ATP-binding cassette domain-containing protein [Calothrix sp. FACHB-1219]